MSAHVRPDVLDPPIGAVEASPVLQIFADSADIALAAALARGLQEEGLAVVGGVFDPARVFAVIVIWSPTSLASPAMIAAARAAEAARPIIPVCVGDARPPADFGNPAPLPLDGWSGDRADRAGGSCSTNSNSPRCRSGPAGASARLVLRLP